MKTISSGSTQNTTPAPSQQAKRNYWAEDSKMSEIPTLISDSKVDLTGQVAAPPSAYVAQPVANLDALNQQLALPTKPEPGIDLSILTSVVKPLDQCYEPDEIWESQHLIMEVSQLIRKDKENVEKDEDYQFQVYQNQVLD
ncbi:unnamed protein product [Blepharisma stoltei]|uniref:Uncharacterized protein n=1 Tax=Blepharisma stoltei TaxID=1481888 RepID=A0AAU9J479_9CILI|nr:unnamed protein product [Blepharisma stoltei]